MQPHRWVAIAVAVAALALAVGLAVPDARTAIFRLFHVGSVNISFVERLPQVQPARPLDLGEPISPTEAPVRLLHSELLGAPDSVYRSGDIVTLLYGTPERVRLLVTQIPASGFTPDVGKKLAATGTRVEFVEIAGSPGPGVWITGRPHLVSLPGGPARLASNTLIWQRGRAHGQDRRRGDDRAGHAHRGVLELGRPEPIAPGWCTCGDVDSRRPDHDTSRSARRSGALSPLLSLPRLALRQGSERSDDHGPSSLNCGRILYPYAKPEPVTYVKSGEPYWGTEETVGGWYVASSTLKEQLVALGLPRLPPTDDGASDVPWPVLGAGALIVAALAGVALFLLRTRPRPATA